MLAIVFSILLSSALSLASPSVQIEYRNGPLHFKAQKTKSEYWVTDEFGLRKLAIKSCNKKLVEEHWSQLVKKAQGIQAKSPAADQAKIMGKAVLKYEGVESRVYHFEPAFKYFNRAPAKAHAVFVESMRQCRRK